MGLAQDLVSCGSVVKNLPASAGDVGSIPGSGRSPVKEMATHSTIFAWEMPWTEEPGKLQSMGLQRVRHDFTHDDQTKCSVTKSALYFSKCADLK